METLNILEIQETLNNIGKEIFEVYDSIIAEKTHISFIPRDLTFSEMIEIGESGELPYFEFINQNGDTICARLVSVNSVGGLEYIEDEDDSESGFCTLMDVYGLNYRLSIVEAMQENI